MFLRESTSLVSRTRDQCVEIVLSSSGIRAMSNAILVITTDTRPLVGRISGVITRIAIEEVVVLL